MAKKSAAVAAASSGSGSAKIRGLAKKVRTPS
jgi:hypothetical protein